MKSSPVNFSLDEIKELQQLVAGMKKELKELKVRFERDIFFDYLVALIASNYQRLELK